MADDIQRVVMPPHALRRLRPSATAERRGFLTIALDRPDGGRRDCVVPVEPGLPLLLRTFDAPVAASIGAGEATIESVGWRQAALALLWRRISHQFRATPRFDGLEIFPPGTSAKAKNYCKQIRNLRGFGLAIDGDFVRQHPELIAGWPAETPAGAERGPSSGPRIAVALHLHYVDLWPEFETLLLRWRQPFSLFLTLTRDNPELARRVRAAFPNSVIRVVDNRGRDVRPFLLLLEEGAFDSFDLVCKIHSKKSIGHGRLPAAGDIIRRAAFLDLIATDRQVCSIVQAFADDPSVGLIGAQRFRLAVEDDPRRNLWGDTRHIAEELAMRMGGTLSLHPLEFFAGTMFWARPGAFEPLRCLRLAEESFAAEADQIDGTLEHTIERLFIHVARHAGFRVEAVAVDDAEPTADAPRPSRPTFKPANAREKFAHRS